MAMELTVYSLNGLLLCCLRSKYEPEIFYETNVTGLQRRIIITLYGPNAIPVRITKHLRIKSPFQGV